GMVTSCTRSIAMLPTRAAVPVLGTNPIAFAAPAKRNAPFLLDMATTSVANNKLKVYDLNGKTLPAGWVLDGKGEPVREPKKAMEIGGGGAGARAKEGEGEGEEGGQERRRADPARRHRRDVEPQGLRPGDDGAYP